MSPADAGAVVYAIAGGDSVSTYPDETGAFLIRALGAGTYDVLAQVSDTAQYQNQTLAGVPVKVGNVTAIDSLSVLK